ncbi:hypothetical protein KI387_012982, partial [Taxus chinensis]
CCCTIPSSFSLSPLPPRKHSKSSNSSQKYKHKLPPSVRRPGRPTLEHAHPSKTDESLEPTTSSNPLRGFTKPPIKNNKNIVDDINSPFSQPQPQPQPQPHLNKLWLSSKLFPQPEVEVQSTETRSLDATESDADGGESTPDDESLSSPQLREKGKIFVGNLPLWIKKDEIAEFFRQFGPVKNVILIKGHNDTERNVGFCFVIYGGPKADDCAVEAVEFDGVEFHGRCLTVKLDDGRRLRAVAERRGKWVKGGIEAREFRSEWHEEREIASQEFKRILETEPENWQKVLNAFVKIKKPSRRDYGLMVNYYARRGDKHHARCTFESMRAKAIEPNSYVYT